ncbi:MAG: Mov34/MPN/PAD-1 family protein [Candidatus Aenigmarchaeota archaeon]|nr:Mov34/MPN/PAD-1 family protein [Candidatus Aenigmarchaeota archaeon]
MLRSLKKILIIAFDTMWSSLPNQGLIEEVILSRVAEDPGKEVCGFLLTDGTDVKEIYAGVGDEDSATMPLRIPLNTAAARLCLTELKKRGITVHKMLPCKKGMPFFVCYHSHPNCDIVPSNNDIKKYLFSSYLFGLVLINYGRGLRKLRCYEVICSPNGKFNWWKMKKIGV